MEHFHQTDILGDQGIETYPPYQESIPPLIREAASYVKSAGGFLYLVGGCVRDLLRGIIPVDWDCEVFELSEAQLELELQEFAIQKFGKKYAKGLVHQVGKGFPVWKLAEMDIALPRRERKVSEGHTGFEIDVDPFMSLGEAAARRDLTVNAIYLDPTTGQIQDPTGRGIDDLRNYSAHPVSHRFKEDPLRVMRAAQFCARFTLIPTRQLLKYSEELQEEFDSLPKERLWAEWDKLLAKGSNPAAGLHFLKQCGWLKFFCKGSFRMWDYNPHNTFRDNLAMLYAGTDCLRMEDITGRKADKKFLLRIHEGLYDLGMGKSLSKFESTLRVCSRDVDNVSLLKAWSVDQDESIATHLEMIYEEGIWRSFHKPSTSGSHLQSDGFKGPAIAKELKRLYIEQMENM